jgi:hypothetical protein
MIPLIIVIVVVVILVGYLIIAYNGLVRSRNQVENAWSQIDVQLKRRIDLIPNLVETVKGYAAHERETLEAVIAARNTAMAAPDTPPAQAEANNLLTGALRQLFALSEAYPGPEGEPELPRPAGGADRHRGSRRLRTPVLQRQRVDLRQQARTVPDGDRREDVQLRTEGILRGRGAGPSGPDGRVLIPPRCSN